MICALLVLVMVDSAFQASIDEPYSSVSEAEDGSYTHETRKADSSVNSEFDFQTSNINNLRTQQIRDEALSYEKSYLSNEMQQASQKSSCPANIGRRSNCFDTSTYNITNTSCICFVQINVCRCQKDIMTNIGKFKS